MSSSSSTSNPLPNIDHVIVLMLENRSFDNLMGWLYDASNPPKAIIGPPGTAQHYLGLSGADFTNPTSFGPDAKKIPAVEGTNNFCIPTPDPNEKFKHMNQQIFGSNVSGPNWLPPEGALATMNGFVVDYAEAKDSSPQIAPQIMQTYSPKQVSAISSLASSYAVSDAWHASNPTQTLPNRAFMAAGTSEGRVNNLPWPVYGAHTIFNVFEDAGLDWKVYSPAALLSLTRATMWRLWDPFLDGHFHSIDRFLDDCANGDLPPYSFLEPLFIEDTFDQSKVTSEHPPTDVCSGEHYLAQIWDAVRNSKRWGSTLFIVTFDEHGGIADHIPTPWTAAPPDSESSPGDEGFGFNRFGVRIPTLMASPYIAEGTVFRSFPDPSARHPDVPYDHTSILATVLDWQQALGQNVSRASLQSARVARAPSFDSVLTLDESTKRMSTEPIVPSCSLDSSCSDKDADLTDLEQGVLGALVLYRENHTKSQAELEALFAAQPKDQVPPAVAAVLAQVKTRAQATAYLRSLGTS